VLDVDQDALTVDLSWDAVAGATTYVVTRELDGGPEETMAVLDASITSYHEDDVPQGIVTYRVGVDGPPVGQDCEAQSVHIHGPEPVPGEARCVAGLSAMATEDGILLQWAAEPGAGGYDVLRAEGAGALAPYAVVGPDATAYMDLGTVAGVSYTYVVAADGLPRDPSACPAVEASAIPDLPGPALAVAALGGTAAFALLLRRRRG
jgi:hypothetical protein